MDSFIREIYSFIEPSEDMIELGFKTIGISLFVEFSFDNIQKIEFDVEVLNSVVRAKVNNEIYIGYCENIKNYDSFYFVIKNNSGVVFETKTIPF